MANLLLAAPDYISVIDQAIEGLQLYTDYEVDFLDLVTPKYRYKNFGERAKNFFLKNFTKINLKIIGKDNMITERINGLRDRYDMIIIIRPDLINDHNLELLRKKTNRFVAYYWDSIKFFPRKLDIRKYFDRIFSFDSNDCRQYGFEFLTNFYFFEHPPVEIKYKVYTLISYDSRHKYIEAVAKKLEDLGISYYFKAYRGRPFKNKYIEHFSGLIEYQDMLKELAAAEVLLDIQKEDQAGLTFRPFEALGLNKKLITTSEEIKQDDFYDPVNILVIDKNNINIPRSFFETPYREIPAEIKKKYHLESWVKRLVS